MPYLRMVAGERYELITPSVLWTRSNPLPKVNIPAAVIKARGLLNRTVKVTNNRGDITGEVKQFQLVEHLPEDGALTDEERLEELARGEAEPPEEPPPGPGQRPKGPGRAPKASGRAPSSAPAVDDDPSKIE